ncbi:MAG: hypothetical protein WBF44_07425, partial [Pseudolabrys sp.]
VRTWMLGQMIGHDLPLVQKRPIVRSFFLLLAEREEFEPTMRPRKTGGTISKIDYEKQWDIPEKWDTISN